ncbi:MAG TPA: Mur ligase family protein [Thermoanaerobaculia bacterium]|nr:Mur ligase family protein [Thermoanaerobaculia bacterium]
MSPAPDLSAGSDGVVDGESARPAPPAAGPEDDPDRILERLEIWGQKLGLERIREVLERLGRPELGLPVVLVAGTNGKGSTAALIAAVVHAAGYRTGLYTSPHLESVEERIRIDGRAIARPALAARLREVLAAAPALPTYFEALTAAALLHFARESVELAVLEVGLGGRLDATNVTEPVLSVITSISFDHQEHLGATLGAIAREKAGILRRGRPALFWSAGDAEVAAALRAAARERGALLDDGHATVDIETQDAAPGGRARHQVSTARGSFALATTLVGAHQGPNVALAVRAAELLADLGFARIDRAAVVAGVRRCRWPGRLERVDLPDGRWVLLDGAHNPAGVGSLLAYLAGLVPTGALDLLYGSLRDKGADLTLPRLVAATHRVTLTRPPADRALDPEELQALAPGSHAEPRVEVALEAALAPLAPGDGLLVCGSLYLTGAVRAALRARHGVPEAAASVVSS